MLRFDFDHLDSTNTHARRLAAEHPGRVLLIRAQTQSAGRGRLDRRWHSPIGGAWFTLVWPCDPAVPSDRYAPAPLLAGLCVHRVLRAWLNTTPRGCRARLTIKWPNDLLLCDRKAAGILCERVILPGAPASLLIGIGINANFSAAQLGDPSDLRHPPTTLRDQTARDAPLDTLIDRCARNLQQELGKLEAVGVSRYTLTAIHTRLAWIDRRVTLERPEGAVTGTLRGIDDRGRLLIESATQTHPFEVGEVHRLRSTSVRA